MITCWNTLVPQPVQSDMYMYLYLLSEYNSQLQLETECAGKFMICMPVLKQKREGSTAIVRKVAHALSFYPIEPWGRKLPQN